MRALLDDAAAIEHDQAVRVLHTSGGRVMTRCTIVPRIRLPRGIGVERLRDAPVEWSRQHHTLGLPWQF